MSVRKNRSANSRKYLLIAFVQIVSEGFRYPAGKGTLVCTGIYQGIKRYRLFPHRKCNRYDRTVNIFVRFLRRRNNIPKIWKF